jgi:hypothetical protein
MLDRGPSIPDENRDLNYCDEDVATDIFAVISVLLPMVLQSEAYVTDLVLYCLP